jgi:hypothetical protein
MPFGFRRSFGGLVRLNISKTGVSVSAGVPGARVNYDLSGRRKKPVRMTVGIPGTGLSYYEDMGGQRIQVPEPLQPKPGPTVPGIMFRVLIALLIVYGIVYVIAH